MTPGSTRGGRPSAATSGSLRRMADAGEGPLEGIRVLDLSRILAGPLATMVLGDLGADVIKVERPGSGDDTRQWGPPFVGEDAAYFLSVNRNKRSIAVDLQTSDGVDVIRRLAARSDVVIENFRPGLMARFGLALEDLRRANPRLVTCSLTAFGEDAGETDARPGYDIMVQALSGLMSVTGERDGEPTKVGVALLDVITGLYAAIGVQAALVERERTGRGRHVGVSLFDASVAALVNQAANHLLGGVVPGPMGSEHPNIVPYQVFHGTDRPFVVAAGNDKLFRAACEVVGLPELADDVRFASNDARVANRESLIPRLRAVFATRPAAEWLAALEGAGVPCAPIRRLDEVFASPEGAAMVQTVEDSVRGQMRLVADPIRMDGTTLPARRPPPRLDEHGGEILRDLER
jgi:glutaryl-CoA transferase